MTAMREKPPLKLRLLLVFLCVALLITAVILLRMQEQQPEQRGQLTENYLDRKTVTIAGKTYAERRGLTPILLIGYDKTESSSDFGYRSGGQSDFMLLTILDEENHTVRRLQLERDTMTEIQVLSILGKDAGTNTLQLCLAHGYGNVPEECNRRTVSAVSHLLQGIDLEYYVAFNIDAIPVLNDAIGGVDVLIEDDFSAIDPVLKMGETVHLEGKHATTFVRTRKQIGSGTNEERMRRHRAYLSAVETKFTSLLKDSASFVNTFFSTVDPILESNLSRGRMINEVNRAKDYDILPVETFPGEYKLGHDGFMEFHPDTDSILSWVLSTFYTPVE